MKRGISPIVAMVLLIAISVIAAVSIYYWALTLGSKPPTPKAPIPIAVNPIKNGRLLIANLGQKAVNTSTLKTSDPNLKLVCNSATIEPGDQVLCILEGNASTGTIVIYGNKTSSASVNLGISGVDSPPSINWVTDNSKDGSILLGQALTVKANVTDDYGLKGVWLNNGTTYSTMSLIGTDIYSTNSTPQLPGLFQYYVKATDTANQTVLSPTKSVSVIQNWMLAYGTANYDEGRSLVSDGNGYLAAASLNYDITAGTGGDIGVLRLNNNGSLDWYKVYSDGSVDHVYSLDKASNGYILAGSSAGGLLVMNINTTGGVQWAKKYGIQLNTTCFIKNISGDYLVSGTAYVSPYNYIMLLKLNSTGGLVWGKAYRVGSDTHGAAVAPSPDGGYVLVGDTNNGSDYNILVIKVNSTGGVEWAEEFGSSTVNERASDIINVNNTGYLIVGYIWGMQGVLALYINNTGGLVWSGTYTTGDLEVANSVKQTGDGYIVVGIYNGASGVGLNDLLLLKLNSTGGISWAKAYGGTDHEEGYYVMETNDSGYVAIGDTASYGAGGNGDVFIVKTDHNGNLVGTGVYTNVTSFSRSAGPSGPISVTPTQISIGSATSDAISEVSQNVTETCIAQPFGCP